MAENAGTTGGPSGYNANERFDHKKQEAAEILLGESLRFVKWDGDVNDMLKDLLSTVVGEVKKNPDALFSSKGDNIETLLSALKAKKPKGGTGVSGGDIIGGGPFSDIIDFINALGNLAAEEKKFFLKIIFLIFCDCECVCKCLCDG